MVFCVVWLGCSRSRYLTISLARISKSDSLVVNTSDYRSCKGIYIGENEDFIFVQVKNDNIAKIVDIEKIKVISIYRINNQKPQKSIILLMLMAIIGLVVFIFSRSGGLALYT